MATVSNGSAYFGHNWDWHKCKCVKPQWKRILDLVLCEKCGGRR